MPRTRADVDRALKVDAILDAAEAQLLSGGHDALSMAAIARRLGVAQNSVYWYFPSRDDVLIAVARRLVERTAGERPPPSADTFAQAVWLYDRLEAATPVRLAVIARSVASPAVAAFREEAHAALQPVVAAWVRAAGSIPEADVDLAAEALLAAGEGLLLRGLPRDDRNRILRYGVDRLLTPG